MQKIGDYTIIELIEETLNSAIYRGRAPTGDSTVVIKVLKAADPSPAMLAQLRYEYDLVRAIQVEGVIRYLDMLDMPSGIAIVMEDFNGIALHRHMDGTPLDVTTFLKYAIQVARILGDLHCRDITHRDIKPHNILLDPASDQIKLVDFGIATASAFSGSTSGAPAPVQGTVLYMSPEQAGRLNRPVDYRTDLYSLGVTFYEMLCGAVPFEGDEPAQLMLAHIARRPRPLHEVRPAIPTALSAIVMRLLEKNPDERYQNGYGLQIDLERCRDELTKQGSIAPFELGTHDFPVKFTLPQVLVEREDAENRILGMYSVIREGGLHCCLVRGAAGIGKTALAGEIGSRVMAQQSWYIHGACDRQLKDVPYHALLRALGGLIPQILANNKETIEYCRKRILAATGTLGRVLTEVIPELELIIGEQPEVARLDAQETQVRFTVLIKSLIRALATQSHPLVLFIDNLQWIDAASVPLLESILGEQEINHLLFIGALRDETDAPADPVRERLMTCTGKSGAGPTLIDLAPLSADATTRLLESALHSDTAAVAPLAALLHKKSGGNPYFLGQLLRQLHERSIIRLDPHTGLQWDIEQARTLQAIGDVNELVTQTLQRLPAQILDILKVCACIGDAIDVDLVARIAAQKVETVIDALNRLKNEDLLYQPGNRYSFTSGRIHEIVSGLIPGESAQRLHLQIGLVMFEQTPTADLDEHILSIASHCNAGLQCIEEPHLRERIIGLNLRAGRIAMQSAAWESARVCFAAALTLAGSDAWRTDPQRTREISEALAEAAYLCGRHDETERIVRDVQANAGAVIDTVGIEMILAQSLFARMQTEVAIRRSLTLLRKLGISLPEHPSRLRVILDFLRVMSQLNRTTDASILELPPVNAPHIQAQMRVLLKLSLAAYFTNTHLYAIVVFLRIRMALRHGMSVDVVSAFASMSAILCGTFGRLRRGYDMARLAIALVDKLKADNQRVKVNVIFNALTQHWIEPLQNTFEPLKRNIQQGIENGDYEYGLLSTYVYAYNTMFSSGNLHALSRTLADFNTINTRYRQANARSGLSLYRQFVENLTEDTADPCVLSGTICEEETVRKFFLDAQQSAGPFSIGTLTLILSYLLGRHERGLEYANYGFRFSAGNRSISMLPQLCFFDALNCLALCRTVRGPRRGALLRRAVKAGKTFKKWEQACAHNCAHRARLIEAEIARVTGAPARAISLYQQAVAGALASDFILDAAVACENSAAFFESIGSMRLADHFRQQAFNHYSRWGATIKARELLSRYPFLAPARPTTGTDGTVHATDNRPQSALPHETTFASTSFSSSLSNATATALTTRSLDVSTIVKVSQALSSEMEGDRLLQQIMRLAIENAGAERGALVMKNQTDSTFELKVTGDAINGVTSHDNVALEHSDDVPVSLIGYVDKSQAPLILKDAIADAQFATDPYIQRRRARSVLAIPIRQKGSLSGIVYLENNLTTDVFAPERLQTLQIILSQAAISIENARLYTRMRDFNAELEAQVRQRTAELVAAQANIGSIMHSIDLAVFCIRQDGTVIAEHSAMAEKLFATTDFAAARISSLLGLDPSCHARWDLWLAYAFSPAGAALKWPKVSRINPVHEIRRKIDGEMRIIELDYQPVREEGRLALVMVIGRDVTVRRQAEEFAAKSQQEKEQQMERVHALITNEADDIRSLLHDAAPLDESLQTHDMASRSPLHLVELMRGLHGIKGTGGSMHFDTLAAAAHQLEDAIAAVQTQGRADKQVMQHVESAITRFSGEIAAIRALRDRLYSANKQNKVVIDQREYAELIDSIRSQSTPDLAAITTAVRNLPYRSWADYCERFGRMIVDYSKKYCKEIDPPVVVNGSIKLEPHLCTLLDQPLTHCIRNAIDHGIESPALRQEQGKGAGKITLSLQRTPEEIRVNISDDGKGISPEALVAAAQARGLIDSHKAAELDDEGKLSLLFLPGLSTAMVTTEISGRGVGMDAVKHTIEAAGGSVRLISKPGKGTTVELRLDPRRLG